MSFSIPILYISGFNIVFPYVADHIFTVYAGHPSSISDDVETVSLIGNSLDIAKQINQKEVHWGVSAGW